LLQVLPIFGTGKGKKKGALNMGNKRLFLPTINPKIRMRIWTIQKHPEGGNIKGTATTKTFSLDSRMSRRGWWWCKRREQIQSQAPPHRGQYGQQADNRWPG